jgi:ABC-2 type transport system permease protein
MTTPSNAMPGSPLESQVVAPAVISATRRLYWSVRRELWESPSIYIAPLAVAAVFLFGFLIRLIYLPAHMRSALTLHQRNLIEQPYDFAALLIMGTAFIVQVFYCLDALHGERRDRSILFWKSLPVSDLMTVISKASIPMVILPLLAFVIVGATQLVMAVLSSAVLLASGLGVVTLWRQLSLFQTLLMLLYHLVTVHMLWYAPIYGWLLLVSSWARRMAFLWAGLPLLAIGVLEKIAFNTSHFAALLGNRMNGGETAVVPPGSFPMDPMTHLTPGHFLSSPGLWIGLAVTAIFLGAAVRLRRYREPI